MTVYVNKANENWVVDKFRKEFYTFSKIEKTKLISKSDTIWVIAPWTWKKLNIKHLVSKTVVCTVHHIDFTKFDETTEKNFQMLDQYVDRYHTISKKSYNDLKTITKKEIDIMPFWINQNNFFNIKQKAELRNELNLPKNKYLIGSFQRDTEGKDLSSPKMSKGPDLFIDYVLSIKNKIPDLHVVLAGKRRQYIISELNRLNITFSYFEMVEIEIINKLYNALDLYIVSSRVEGGPQALMECAITKTPVISNDVGFATEMLSSNSIIENSNPLHAIPDVEFAYKNIEKLKIPYGINNIEKLLTK